MDHITTKSQEVVKGKAAPEAIIKPGHMHTTRPHFQLHPPVKQRINGPVYPSPFLVCTLLKLKDWDYNYYNDQ